MPIINLTIEGKQAIGDGTKIVCMNSDYIVRVNFENCDDLQTLPVKKLIVKCGTDYRESLISSILEDGVLISEAALPLVERQTSVELGVCGKWTNDDDEPPVFTSKPAVFACEKSILCGALVLKDNPELVSLDVTQNGTYNAAEMGVDGFFEVTAQVESKVSEHRRVDLSMIDGDQVISPSGANRTMEQVTVTKPLGLVPENIKHGVTIGGVTGAYKCPEPHIIEVDELPATGAEGNMYLKDDTYYIYEKQENGNYGWSEYIDKDTAILTPVPIDVATESEMTQLLNDADASHIGAIYRFTGTLSPIYTTGALYMIVEVT